MVNYESFQCLHKGKRVGIYTLRNARGMRAQITNYGAKIVSLYAPDKNGAFADVVLGFSDFKDWVEKETYFNAIIGRYANRIKDGKFALNGQIYTLAQNNGDNHLHGGVVGFNEQVWEVVGQSAYSVSMHYKSKDGEEGYPGNLDVYVTYRLTNQNALEITCEAKTDKTTIVALTNHAYFNLKGEGNGDIRDHVLQVHAHDYTPFDETACPTGKIAPVAHTPMDFRQPTRIGERIDDPFFAAGRGIDNNFVLQKEKANALTHAATLQGGERTMEVWTTAPGLQVYTGNWIEKNIGKAGKEYNVQTAVCLEAQFFPNSPNIASFPSVILKPKDIYFQQILYKFV